MTLIPLVLSWAVLATVVLGLAVYRKTVARGADAYIHFDAPATIQQEVITNKLEVIDKWGKLLTIVAAIFAVVLLGAFLYHGWVGSNSIS